MHVSELRKKQPEPVYPFLFTFFLEMERLINHLCAAYYANFVHSFNFLQPTSTLVVVQLLL